MMSDERGLVTHGLVDRGTREQREVVRVGEGGGRSTHTHVMQEHAHPCNAPR